MSDQPKPAQAATQQSERWPDLAGRIVGLRHVLPVRVYFEDTDFSGIVYHASYIRWCERGRSDFLRLAGVSHAMLASSGGQPPQPEGGTQEGVAPQGVAFAVRRLEVDYRRPGHIDDVLEVTTALASVGRADCWLHQTITRGSTLLCEARVQAVLISGTGRLQRLDRLIGPTLSKFLPQPD